MTEWGEKKRLKELVAVVSKKRLNGIVKLNKMTTG